MTPQQKVEKCLANPDFWRPNVTKIAEYTQVSKSTVSDIIKRMHPTPDSIRVMLR